VNPIPRLILALSLFTLFSLTGCDDRTTQVAIDAADRQAQQNQELARLDREHASARKELVELHQQVQTERQSLSAGWQDLHVEQKTVIQERRTESLIVKLVPVLLTLIAAFFVVRLVSRWLDYKTVETMVLVGHTPERVASISSADALGLETTPTPTGEPHESPRDDRDPRYVNYHRFLGSPEIVQGLAHAVEQGKRNRTFVILLSPQAELPRELEKLFVVLRHELPSRKQLAAIARELATGDELPTGAELEAVLDATAGLTRYEAEGALSLSLVRDRRLTPPTILAIKAQQLQQSNLVTMHDPYERFSDLGGLAALKAFCLRTLRPRPHDSPVQPKGVLLSPPGCGKSAIAKALGNEVNRPTLRLDLGALRGSLVGQPGGK